MLRWLASIRPCVFLRVVAFAALLWGKDVTAGDADDSYSRGIAAFNEGRYEQALAQFLEARSLGMNDPALDYNLGSTYFKLERYAEAERAFLDTARDAKLAALAYYNVGLCRLRLGEVESANSSFERVLQMTDNARLRALAQASLDETREVEARASPERLAFLSAGVGYDSNVSLLSDRDVLQSSRRQDSFLDLSAYGSASRSGESRTLATGVDASANLLKYAKLSDYDLADLRLGGTLEHDGDWNKEAGAHFDYAFASGEPFTRETLFSLSASRELSPLQRLRLRYEYGVIDAVDAIYRYLDGHRNRFGARLSLRRGEATFAVDYELETNARRDLQTPLFTSYSPVRNGIRLIGELPIGKGLELDAEARLVHSRYRDRNEIDTDVFARRVDNRLSADLSLVYSLRDDTDVVLDYLYTRNQSSIDRYEYTQNLFTLGLSQVFQ